MTNPEFLVVGLVLLAFSFPVLCYFRYTVCALNRIADLLERIKNDDG